MSPGPVFAKFMLSAPPFLQIGMGWMPSQSDMQILLSTLWYKIIRFQNGKIERQFIPQVVYLRDLQQTTVMTSAVVVIDILQVSPVL